MSPTHLYYTNQHSPIGLHAGMGGRLNGAGKPNGYWVQLAKAGKRPVVKSTDNYGPIYEALQFCDKYGVDGVFVFRLTIKDGFNFDTPRWDLSPKDAADIHFRNYLKHLPAEFDKRVWIEPINEPDKDEDDRMPDWTPEDFSQWLGEFAYSFTDKITAHGYRVTMFGFSSGEPELIDWEQPSMTEFLKLAADHPEKVAISLHEYAYSDSLLAPQHEFPWLIGRFTKLHDYCDSKNISRPTIHITEFGWRHNDIPDTEIALKELDWAAKELYGQYLNIDMVAIWYFGGGYGEIANKAVKLIPGITDLALNFNVEVELFEQPVIEPPTDPEEIDLAPYFFPPGNRDSGNIYMFSNNWGEGPERMQLIRKGNFSYMTKNNNWERRYISPNYIYLQVDTSMGSNSWYKIIKGKWLPRKMKPGAIFKRNEHIQIFTKDSCQMISDYLSENYIRFDGLNNDIAAFTWFLNGEAHEQYYYKKGLGLYEWHNADGKKSKFDHFVPEHEIDNTIPFQCEEQYEWIPQEDINTTPIPIPTPGLPPYITGIDISHWQGTIDAEKAYQAGAQFAYIKATQAATLLDSMYFSNTQRCLDYGILVGSYHFFDPHVDGAVQADFFIETVKNSNAQNLPPALDLERHPTKDVKDANQYRRNILAFLEIVSDKLVQPIIYTNVSWFNIYLNTADFDQYELWIANWTDGTKPYLPIRRDDWLFWQIGTKQGSQFGVQSSRIDFNYCVYEDFEKMYEVFGENWLETPEEEPIPVVTAPLREDYPRIVHLIDKDFPKVHLQSVWELAKSNKQTITFSYDDAGATPVTQNTIMIWGIPEQKKSEIKAWFTFFYPDSTLIFRNYSLFDYSESIRQAIQSGLIKGKRKEVFERLRRSLVQLF
jgi:lysozyme